MKLLSYLALNLVESKLSITTRCKESNLTFKTGPLFLKNLLDKKLVINLEQHQQDQNSNSKEKKKKLKPKEKLLSEDQISFKLVPKLRQEVNQGFTLLLMLLNQ